ncbi:UDP-N-acetylmuramate dehydrogenase [Adhaeribacter aquaticus]|uniref:UDP-N-acetylmuramate dehydrogenase n=1 Tax=Adhaeribacter aquaticus TaxID=299567 RepID=UPI000413F4E6|nr:UDP-N-acetylmuramate dehydrogenase [Adhaeribacter aquaticus]
MKVFKNFDLTNYNSYKIKAICARAFFPDTEEDIREIYQGKTNNLILIGSGHNIILSKEYYEEDFIIFSGNFESIIFLDDTTFTVEAGATLLQLSEMAYEKSLSGLEMFYDIPSSVGGAVVMNAGAGGEEIKDLLVKVRYYNPHNNTFNEITKEEINFEYRNSFFQRNPGMIITNATLRLEPKDKALIRQKMDSIKEARCAKQPKDFPNAGSVFKRPPGKFVGPMIDELGLKGYSIGGAKVSEKHSGFIINFNNAKGADILNLIEQVKEKVLVKFQIELEVEQRII